MISKLPLRNRVTGGMKLYLLFKIVFEGMAMVWQEQPHPRKAKSFCCVEHCVARGLFCLVNNSFVCNLLSLPGIDVRKGRGRYIDTCMVTFAPRYLLDNKSSYKLAFLQQEFARGRVSSCLFVTCQCSTYSEPQHPLTTECWGGALEII